MQFSTQTIIGKGTNSDIDTDEETVLEITSLEKLTKSQITLYITTSLGTHTSMEYRFYYAAEVGGTYHARPKWNASDNTIDAYPAIVDGNSPAPLVFEFGFASCYAFKVTGKGVGGANGTSTIVALGRDN